MSPEMSITGKAVIIKAIRGDNKADLSSAKQMAHQITQLLKRKDNVGSIVGILNSILPPDKARAVALAASDGRNFKVNWSVVNNANKLNAVSVEGLKRATHPSGSFHPDVVVNPVNPQIR